MIEIDVEIKTREIKAKKKYKPLRIFSCGLIFLLIMGGVGFFLYQQYRHYTLVKEQVIQQEITNQVKSQSKNDLLSDYGGDSLERYQTVNAVVPYAKTKLKPLLNFVYNFSIDYPVNTTALVKNADGDQIWFLRRDGYMFKINIYSQNSPKQTLDDFYNSLTYKDKYVKSNAKFAKENAILLTLKDQSLTVTGNEYIVFSKGYFFVIWYETFPNNQYPDDTKRIEDMLKSFVFI